MKKAKLRLTKVFVVVLGNRKAQAAEMVLRRGDKEGDSHNRHRGADQWLFVVSGDGVVIVNGTRHPDPACRWGARPIRSRARELLP